MNNVTRSTFPRILNPPTYQFNGCALACFMYDENNWRKSFYGWRIFMGKVAVGACVAVYVLLTHEQTVLFYRWCFCQVRSRLRVRGHTQRSHFTQSCRGAWSRTRGSYYFYMTIERILFDLCFLITKTKKKTHRSSPRQRVFFRESNVTKAWGKFSLLCLICTY